MLDNTQQPNSLKLLLTVDEVAGALSLGRNTVYQMVNRGEIPCVRIGRAVRVQKTTLDAFVAERTNA